MKKKELLGSLNSKEYNSDIKDYLTELILLKYSPFKYVELLDKLELTPLEREILKYNLSIKAINAVAYNLPEKTSMELNKGDRFSIYVTGKQEWPIINMKFCGELKLSYYDRSKILKDKFDLLNKLDELNDEYHHNYYVYKGHMDKELEQKAINIKETINEITDRLYDVSLMSEDKEVFYLDKILIEELALPEKENSLVRSSEIFDTYDVTNNKKILVHKKIIRK